MSCHTMSWRKQEMRSWKESCTSWKKTTLKTFNPSSLMETHHRKVTLHNSLGPKSMKISVVPSTEDLQRIAQSGRWWKWWTRRPSELEQSTQSSMQLGCMISYQYWLRVSRPKQTSTTLLNSYWWSSESSTIKRPIYWAKRTPLFQLHS